eukprot:7114128-Heterocapsa_arctica.AAC.1
MYRTPRIIKVHKSNTEPVEANRGILAGRGDAAHYLMTMIKEEIKDEGNELRDFVDDMVLFKEEDTEEQAITGLHKDLTKANQHITNIGQ